MPTYEYQCGKCGHRFEKIQKISDSSRVECPRCENIAERLISGGAGLLFKGSGFYITDYRSKSYQEAAKKETKKDSSPSVASSGKSDTAKGAEKSSSQEDSK
ncbi:MAG: zinc ribbon domain-containing protein [Gemmatimonadetes bacterium]|nr:zinc ribbon domain-containing protein [Gemmatimonadota bacterium]NIO32525.1 zinc ribbon domain-containing protein [Gemmatimonadota bacterium]